MSETQPASQIPPSAKLLPPAVRICEGCGKRANLHPWPKGWFEVGISSKFAKIYRGESRSVVAAWCGQECYGRSQE